MKATVMPELTVYAAVLAGGRSTRMGQDKRFLELSGEPLVDRALRLATAAIGGDSACVLLCGTVPGRNSLPDVVAGIGPLGGLLTAVEHVHSKAAGKVAWLLVLPVDMPLLDAQTLHTLVTAIADDDNQGGATAAISYVEHEMPFVLRIDPRTYAALLDTIGNNQSSMRSVREFQRRVGVRHLTCATEPSHQLMNVNRPQEWASVRRGQRDELAV